MIRFHAEARCDFDGCKELRGGDFFLHTGAAAFLGELVSLGWFPFNLKWFCPRHKIVVVLDEDAAPCARRSFHEEVVNV